MIIVILPFVGITKTDNAQMMTQEKNVSRLAGRFCVWRMKKMTTKNKPNGRFFYGFDEKTRQAGIDVIGFKDCSEVAHDTEYMVNAPDFHGGVALAIPKEIVERFLKNGR